MIRTSRTPRLTTRLALDAAMLLLLAVLLNFRTTGGEAHEWLGMAFCLCLAIHVFWNRTWYAALPTGNYTAHRTAATAINLLLTAAMVTVCVCGILLSRHIFTGSIDVSGERIRGVHAIASYWSLLLVGVHTGLHGGIIAGVLRKRFSFARANSITEVAAVAIVLSGVWAFCERDMGAKLFLGFSFDYWPPERPLALLYGCNVAIPGMAAVMTHAFIRMLRGVSGRGKHHEVKT